jgi:hypothetical protein
MFYEYIKAIDSIHKFDYLSIVAAVILLATRFGHYGMLPSSAIIGLIVGTIVVFYLNEKSAHQGDTFLSSIQEILNAKIMKPEKNHYLFGNSELIIFLDNHREYYQYNPDAWRGLVKLTDNFLRIVGDIEIEAEAESVVGRYNHDYDMLKDTKHKIMNKYHAFIHTLPHTENTTNKFHEGIERLETLLNKEIDHIHQLVNKMNAKGVTTSSAFHYKNHPVGYESVGRAEDNYTYFVK